MLQLNTLVNCSKWDGITIPHVDGRHITFDLTSLIAQLILSDHVIVRSSALGEIEPMVKGFGFDATLDLLASNALSIYCHYVLVADLSQTQGFGTIHRPDPLPLFAYHFGFQEPQGYLDLGLRHIDRIDGLTLSQTSALKKAVTGRLVPPDPQVGRNALDQLARDLRENRGYVRLAIQETLQRGGVRIDDRVWSIKFTEPSQHDYHADTDLPVVAGLPDRRASSLISSGLMALAQLNISLEEMRQHDAIDEFRDDDFELIRARLSHPLALLNPTLQERRLWRVIGLHRSSVPAPPYAHSIDIGALLRFRETSECGQFRRWLAETDDISDDDLRREINSLGARIGSAAATAVGRTLRWVAFTALGLAVEPMVGIAVGAADAFLLDRLLRVPTPILVLNRDVPSIFANQPRAAG